MFRELVLGNDGGEKVAGREFDPGESDFELRRSGMRANCRKIVERLRIEQRFFRNRSGGNDAGDGTFDESLCFFGIFDLIADGNTISGSNDFGDVRIELMVGKPCHRHSIGSFITAGKGKSEDFGGDFCVVVKRFVKIPHSEQEQCFGADFFGFMKLPHHRRFMVECGHILHNRAVISLWNHSKITNKIDSLPLPQIAETDRLRFGRLHYFYTVCGNVNTCPRPFSRAMMQETSEKYPQGVQPVVLLSSPFFASFSTVYRQTPSLNSSSDLHFAARTVKDSNAMRSV